MKRGTSSPRQFFIQSMDDWPDELIQLVLLWLFPRLRIDSAQDWLLFWNVASLKIRIYQLLKSFLLPRILYITPSVTCLLRVQELLPFTGLRELNPPEYHPANTFTELFAALPHLTSLTMNNECFIRSDQIELIAPRLEVMELLSWSCYVDWRTFRLMTRLHSLSVTFVKCGYMDAKRSLSSLSQLRTLQISSSDNIYADDILHLTELHTLRLHDVFTKLRGDMHNNPNAFSALVNLTALEVTSCNWFNNYNFSSLPSLSQLTVWQLPAQEELFALLRMGATVRYFSHLISGEILYTPDTLQPKSEVTIT
jgi:hypothetical protein